MSTQYESHMAEDSLPLPHSDGFDFMKKLPTLLRILGTGALLVAMYTFLIKGWQSGSDTLRYLLMLGHTSVLAIIGLASGVWLKESKGARLLLTLALVSIPANFAILGAFIFSQFGIDANVHYPNFVAWSADSVQGAMATTGVALLFLIPTAWLGFSVLARSISKRLTVLFLISNAALLLPIRDPMVIGLMVLGLAVLGIVFFQQNLRKHIATKTREGMIAVTLQALPLAMLMGRTLWLYSADLFLLLVMALAVFLFLRQISVFLDKRSVARNMLNLLSVVPAIASLIITVMLLIEVNLVAQALVLPIASLVAGLLIYDIAQRENEYATIYRWFAGFIVASGLFVNMYLHTGAIASLLAIGAGIGLIVLGYRNKQRSFFIIGSLMMMVGIVEQLFYLVQNFDLGSWASLAVLGVLAIVVGSVIEAKGEKIQHRFVKLKDNFRSWEG